MCGIFGVIAKPSSRLKVSKLQNLARDLFIQAESRGKDSSGVMIIENNTSSLFKVPYKAQKMMKSAEFKELMKKASMAYLAGEHFIVLGHTRMVTNGSSQNHGDNQPFSSNETIVLHNGIIVNEVQLWKNFADRKREFEVDTEIFSVMFEENLQQEKCIVKALQVSFKELVGANTVAVIHNDFDVICVCTSNSSLYIWQVPSLGLIVFASEEFVLSQIRKNFQNNHSDLLGYISQLKPYNIFAIDYKNNKQTIYDETISGSFKKNKEPRRINNISETKLFDEKKAFLINNIYSEIEKKQKINFEKIKNLRRCSSCLLPETFPFIKFDFEGVCNFCNQFHSYKLQGKNSLNHTISKLKNNGIKPRVLVPISGGRDSCFALHYIKRELEAQPVAYTYDWGFVTDLARRNISRMCGELNVEHILVAADIKWKRDNVRKNFLAWIAKPELGMIPLLMAGDKHFFYYASKVKKQQELDLIMFSMNRLEKTGFKAGFAGVNETKDFEKTYGLSAKNISTLGLYYGMNFLKNPKYINTTVLDTLTGFMSFYLAKKDYEQLFDFIPWDEQLIQKTLVDQYDWESAPDTKSTWRIGDGTAPFYNYAYLKARGFTEHDTFRSNQIREGQIDRKSAFKLVTAENIPRPEAFKWYCDTINVDAVTAINAINQISMF